ncbi:MAG TPA: phosphoserine phosphatase [Coxiellaceae bacterium]|nr:phosphoserine phosphatase [Coxiellaceae bacterium]
MDIIWPLADAVFFDCDGTLSRIEGINFLAERNGVGQTVKELTEHAMSQASLSKELYEQRLSEVRPTRGNFDDLVQAYHDNVSEDLIPVITLLQRLGVAVYVISAGNNPAVSEFAQKIGVPGCQVFCVDIEFDPLGNFQSYDRSSPLIRSGGKAELIQQLRASHGWSQVVLVGDGMNDAEASGAVEVFVGYGGHGYREKIAAMASVYLSHPSMAALLPIVLSSFEVNQLSKVDKQLYEKGLTVLSDGDFSSI